MSTTRAFCLSFLLACLPACSMDTDMPPDGTPDGGRPPGPTPTCTDRAPLDNFLVDVPAVTLSGKITVSGQIPTANTGTVTLIHRETGDSLYLGRTGDPMYQPKLVVPGTYDVLYSWNGQTTMTIDVPRNSAARIKTGLVIKDSGALDIDIPAVTLSGKITVNGQIPTANTGSISLREQKGNDAVLLGRTADPNYTPKLVVPGTYDLVYSWNNQTTAMIDVPRNSAARLKTGIAIKDSGALDVDIPAVSLTGKITVNGQIPMTNTGSVSLRETATGDSAFLGRTADPSYTQKLIVPGTYDLVYSWNNQTTAMIDVPRNSAARLKTGVAVKDSGALDVDIPAVSLTGKITVNGQIPMTNTGSVTLREQKGGDSLLLGRTADPSYAQKLIVPGTYDIVYSWNNQTTAMIDVPRNSAARLKTGVAVKDSGALDVDIPAVTLSGKLTINGQIPTSNTGSISLREAQGGDSLLLGRTADPSYAQKLIVPGTYDVFYSYSQQGGDMIDVPRNANARIKTGVAVKDSGALDVDVPAVMLKGSITVNGKTPASRGGQVLLANPAISDSVQLGRTGDATFLPKLIVPAPYNIIYGWLSNNEPVVDVPRNSAALLGCKLLAPPTL